MQIRTATPADAAGIAELFATGDRAADTETLGRRIAAVLHAPGTILLALEWGPPSGVVAVSWHSMLHADAVEARIATLFVAPGDRRRGLGRLLLKAAAQAARSAGCDTILLPADPARPEIGLFAEANGFEEDGRTLRRALRKNRGAR